MHDPFFMWMTTTPAIASARHAGDAPVEMDRLKSPSICVGENVDFRCAIILSTGSLLKKRYVLLSENRVDRVEDVVLNTNTFLFFMYPSLFYRRHRQAVHVLETQYVCVNTNIFVFFMTTTLAVASERHVKGSPVEMDRLNSPSICVGENVDFRCAIILSTGSLLKKRYVLLSENE
jgi:hypothetical protein